MILLLTPPLSHLDRTLTALPSKLKTDIPQGIIAGVPFFNEVFQQLDCTVEWHHPEGSPLPPNTKTHVATVRGSVRKILLGERVALNTLARCSGIATQSSKLLSIVRKAGYKNTLAGTRKTTPGFR
jgi:nicotinate-nucleotide pyrophosphorylase (carboxylating)